MPTDTDRLLRHVRRLAFQSGPEPGDSQLLERYLTGGDPAAFEAMVTRHGPMVLRVCQHVLGNCHDAEDAFQATFLVPARKTPGVRSTGCLAGWLHGVASRVASVARRGLTHAVPGRGKLGPLLLAVALTAGLAALGHQLYAGRPPGAEPPRPNDQEQPTNAEFQKGREPRLDLHGDLLPEGALARLGTVRMRHGHAISGVVFSRDGKSIIASDYESGVHVWDVAEGKEVRQLLKDAYYCHSVALSPDGRTLAVALGDQSVRLCDPSSGREFASLPAASERNSPLLFSNDGSLVTRGVDNKAVHIWDVATGRQIHKVTFALSVGSASLSGDGNLLACPLESGFASGNSVCLWDLAQGKEVRRLSSDPDGYSLKAIFAPRGDALAVWGYADASVRLFEANGAKEIRRFKVEGHPLTRPRSPWGWSYHIRAGFSPSGKTLAIFRELGKIELWDVETGKKVHTLACDRFHKPAFLVFSPDGTKLASAGRGWGYWGDDNNGGDNIVRVWDVTQGKEMLPLAGHGAPILAVAISPDGKTVATTSQDGLVHLWERSSGKHLFRLEGHPDRRPQVAFSSDGRRVIWWGTYATPGTLCIWDARTGQEVSRLKQQGPDSYWMAASDDGKTALSVDAKGKSVRFHDLATGKVTHEVADWAYIPLLVLSPAGDKMVSADGTLMNVVDRKERLNVGRLGWPNPSARFSADGRTLVAAVVGHLDLTSGPPAEEIAVFDATLGKELRRFGNVVGKFHAIDAAGLSRDGKMVITVCHRNKVDEQTITLWETETGRERGHFIGHVGPTNSVAVSADGRFVVTGADDTTALVWDATRPHTRNSSPRQAAAAADFAACFKDLAGANAEQAYASISALINAPKKTVSFLGEQSSLFTRADLQAIQRWIRDLDSNEFPVRERASYELGLILDEAEVPLKKALQSKPSAEARHRIDLLLQERSTGASGRELQRLRVIEILEHLAAAGADAAPDKDTTRLTAVALLEKFAAGAPEARPTREAKASLERLERRAEKKH
jgi:WD40 repeat protein/DNA-directed RNA polymerase specialized sigma24 family protein